jgi:DNA invertase Pin-like site-specific DNA recombinase
MTTPVVRAIGYRRVSDVSQVDNSSLAGQGETLTTYALSRGWQIELRQEQGGAASGKTLQGRDVLNATLDELDRGEHDALIVAKLDRLARNTLDGLDILRRATANGWTVVILDLNIDTSTPVGEAMVSVLWAFATMERRIILERTAAGRKRAKDAGKHLGMHTAVSDDDMRKIVNLRAEGKKLREIVQILNVAGSKSPTGKPWNTGTVSRVQHSVTARRLAQKPKDAKDEADRSEPAHFPPLTP